MTDTVKTNPARKYQVAQAILLLLFVASSPLGCCGCAFMVDAFYPAQIPMMDLFEANVQVDNRSGETLYLTPITTTYGYPLVIEQQDSIRQKNFSLQPDQSIVLAYDKADAGLDGIVVCRTDDNCRLLPADRDETYTLDSFESLPALEPDWLLAVQSYPLYSLMIPVFLGLSLLPVVLFLAALYLGRLR